MTSKNPVTELMNSLLRAELSACATYQHVVEKTKIQRGLSEIKRFLQEHQQATQLLAAHIKALGGIPSQEASTWKTIDMLASETSAEPLNDPTAIKALREGEEQDVLTYENAVRQNLDPKLTTLIREKLLPQTEARLPLLDKLLAGV